MGILPDVDEGGTGRGVGPARARGSGAGGYHGSKAGEGNKLTVELNVLDDLLSILFAKSIARSE